MLERVKNWNRPVLCRLCFVMMLWSYSIMAQPSLSIDSSQRYLVKSDGTAFFWMGDTAWELFHRLSREEADLYLRNRAEKGFTVIQAVVLAELDGLNEPNFYGERPLEENDPTKPREAYFQHVDYIVRRAGELGLYIGLLPTWGDKLFKESWGTGPEIFNADNAYSFGRWIGNRYRNTTNIIWILGGDRNPRNENDLVVWRAMARGIAEGVGGHDKAFMTFHPQPNNVNQGGSAQWFHQDNWLDFNMLQTGHCRENTIYDRIQYVYHLSPAKPVINGEPIYEDHPVCFNAKDLGMSNAYDVRRDAYLSVFAGAFGHTYGCHDVWQMWAPHRQSINGASIPWYVALDLPGASQMKYLRKLMESHPITDRFPDNRIVNPVLGSNDRIQATLGKDYIMVYSSQGKPFTVSTGKISGKEILASWFNPRNGEVTAIGKFPKKQQQQFTPPSQGYGHDWVLVVDDASKNYPIR